MAPSNDRARIATDYRRCAEIEAAVVSPLYAEPAAAVAGDDAVLDFLVPLPTGKRQPNKRQPNLLFAPCTTCTARPRAPPSSSSTPRSCRTCPALTVPPSGLRERARPLRALRRGAAAGLDHAPRRSYRLGRWDDAAVTAEPGPTEWGRTVGVGPWPGPWPTEPRYDPELLAHGDRRNVVDRYRYWTVEAIVADLDARRHPFHVAIENFGHDLNIGTVVRTANAFLAAEVHVVGRRRWNRRGAMVTDRYQHLRHHADVAGLATWAAGDGLALVAVDNGPGAVPLETVALPERCVLLFGQEGPGLTAEARAVADLTVSIAQFGSTRSINAGVAAGIAMHAWIRQHADLGAAR
jgi:tRNA(Leu) C34 or U34 (ribose-2'-O)-methylase TrmL